MKECGIFRGSKYTLTLHIFRGQDPLNSIIYAREPCRQY